MKKSFLLLKQTYPISEFDRKCDAYKHILDNTTIEQRNGWGISDDDLQKIIKEGEKYLYRVAKVNGELEYMDISLKNFEIIRKYFYIFND